jgi:hypothetical protein
MESARSFHAHRLDNAYRLFVRSERAKQTADAAIAAAAEEPVEAPGDLDEKVRAYLEEPSGRVLGSGGGRGSQGLERSPRFFLLAPTCPTLARNWTGSLLIGPLGRCSGLHFGKAH